MITTRMDPATRFGSAWTAPASSAPAYAPLHAFATDGAPFPVLAAVTDDELRESVLAVTAALARERHADPTLLAVVEIGPVVTPDGLLACTMMADELDGLGSRAELVAHYRSTLHLGEGAPATWPLEVEIGGSAMCIIDEARRTGASLILTGLHRHARADRLLGTDTLHNILSMGGGPVLAVRPTLTALPSRVVAAVDFSPASIRAARLARSLMADSGTLHLAFVDSGGFRGTGSSATGLHHIGDHGIDAVFAELIEALGPTPDVTISPVILRGGATAELTRFCETVQPDVVTLGQRRHPLLERLMRGSVAHDMVRDARWSVLLAPE